MQTSRKVAPGQNGTKKLLDQYGAQLFCVHHHRYDRQQQHRFKTVELVIEGAPWSPPLAHMADATSVGIRVAFQEFELQRRVKQAGGKWNAAPRFGRFVTIKLWRSVSQTALKTRKFLLSEAQEVSDTRNLCLVSETLIGSLIHVRY